MSPSSAPGGVPTDGASPELLRALYPKVRAWARSLTADDDEADDVTQEALLRVWRAAGRFDGRSGFESWVYAVTRNAARDRWRRESRQRRARGRAARSPVVDPRPRIEAKDRLDRSLAALRRLPEPQRRALTLAALGFDSAEAAERMRVRPGTARARVCRGRAALAVASV